MRIIRVRGTNGEIKKLSPAKFQSTFGASYAHQIVAPDRLPADFLSHCRSYGKMLERNVGKERAGLLRSQVKRGYIAPTYIARIDEEVGFGLFAHKALSRDEMIGEYTGILTQEWTPNIKSAAGVDPYLLKFPFPARYAIDAKEAGNETRFINHSRICPNAGRIYVFQDRLLHVVLTASQAIRAGDQIVFDYGNDYWFERTPSTLTL